MPESLPLELGQEVLFDELGQEVSKHKCPGIPPGRHSPELHLDNGVSIQESGTRRLCNRRFSSGRDLERHMRAHGSLSLQDTALCDGQDAGLVDSSPDLAVPKFSGEELGSASLQPLLPSMPLQLFTSARCATRNSTASQTWIFTEGCILSMDCGAIRSGVADLSTRTTHLMRQRPVYVTKEDSEETMSVARKMKGHECSICHRVFTSGQALGGHKRCHWGGAGSSSDIASVVSNNKQHTMLQSGHTRGLKEKILDLNLPAPSDDPDYVHALAPLVSAYANRLASASILYSTEERIAPEQGDEVVETSLTSTQNGMDLTQHTGLTEDGMEFSCTRYIRCNMCDRLFTSMEALCNHRKTHSAIMSSVTGLTPISA